MKNQSTALYQKHPFNAAGFLALQQEWLQMDSTALWAEAKHIYSTFRPWLYQHFNLSSNQWCSLMDIGNEVKPNHWQQELATRLQTIQLNLYNKILELMLQAKAKNA